MDLTKLRPDHVRRFVRARRRWARFEFERRVGFMIRRWPLHGSSAAELGLILDRLQIDVVIDVGAHHGGFGTLIRRLGHRGPIISFEPASEAFAAVSKRARADGDWTVHHLALGSEAGSMTLDLYPQTQLNSLRGSTEQSPLAARPVDHERVEVRTLDELWADLITDGARVLLKIDTQGFDLEVLRGAERALTRSAAVLTEVSGIPLYEGSPPLHEVIEHLYHRSFRLTGLFPVLRSPVDQLQVIDFDATFVNVNDLDAEAPR